MGDVAGEPEEMNPGDAEEIGLTSTIFSGMWGGANQGALRILASATGRMETLSMKTENSARGSGLKNCSFEVLSL